MNYLILGTTIAAETYNTIVMTLRWVFGATQLTQMFAGNFVPKFQETLFGKCTGRVAAVLICLNLIKAFLRM